MRPLFIRTVSLVALVLFMPGQFAFAQTVPLGTGLSANAVGATGSLPAEHASVCKIQMTTLEGDETSVTAQRESAISGENTVTDVLARLENASGNVVVNRLGISLEDPLSSEVLGTTSFNYPIQKATLSVVDGQHAFVWNEQHQLMIVDIRSPRTPVVALNQFEKTSSSSGIVSKVRAWKLGNHWVTFYNEQWYLWGIIFTEDGKVTSSKETLFGDTTTPVYDILVHNDVLYVVQGEAGKRRITALNEDMHIKAEESVADDFLFNTISTIELSCEKTEIPSKVCISVDTTLRRGGSGKEVADAQVVLGALGHHAGVADGSFGIRTWLAVVDFQKEQELSPSGVINEETRVLLNEKFRAGDCAQYGPNEPTEGLSAEEARLTCRQTDSEQMFRAQGSEVATVQEMLTRLGYGLGQVDGRFGTKTVRAIIAFQRNNKLTLSARTDTSTRDTLNKVYKDQFCTAGLEREPATLIKSGSALQGALHGSCTMNLARNTHTQCVGRVGINFVGSPERGKSVMKVSLDPKKISATQIRITAIFGERPRGWVLNVGDSATNNGWGSDAKTQERNSELQIRGGLLSIYVDEVARVRQGQEHALTNEPLPLEKMEGGKMVMTIENTTVSYTFTDAKGNVMYTKTHTDPNIFALAGQADALGVNYDVYIGLNRSIATTGRDGKGITDVQIELLDKRGDVAIRELLLSSR